MAQITQQSWKSKISHLCTITLSFQSLVFKERLIFKFMTKRSFKCGAINLANWLKSRGAHRLIKRRSCHLQLQMTIKMMKLKFNCSRGTRFMKVLKRFGKLKFSTIGGSIGIHCVKNSILIKKCSLFTSLTSKLLNNRSMKISDSLLVYFLTLQTWMISWMQIVHSVKI